MEYVQRVLGDLKARHGEQREFLQAANEVLTSLAPVMEKKGGAYEAQGLLEQRGCLEGTVHRFFLVAQKA